MDVAENIGGLRRRARATVALGNRRAARDEPEPQAELEREPAAVGLAVDHLDPVVDCAPERPPGGVGESALAEQRREIASNRRRCETLPFLRLGVGASLNGAPLLAPDPLVACVGLRRGLADDRGDPPEEITSADLREERAQLTRRLRSADHAERLDGGTRHGPRQRDRHRGVRRRRRAPESELPEERDDPRLADLGRRPDRAADECLVVGREKPCRGACDAG